MRIRRSKAIALNRSPKRLRSAGQARSKSHSHKAAVLRSQFAASTAAITAQLRWRWQQEDKPVLDSGLKWRARKDSNLRPPGSKLGVVVSNQNQKCLFFTEISVTYYVFSYPIVQLHPVQSREIQHKSGGKSGG